jgi:hypothetical protein
MGGVKIMGFSLKVEDYYPSLGQIDVDRETTIKVYFNRDIKKESVNGNFLVEKNAGDTTFTPVVGTITCAGKEISFTPSVSLDIAASYRVTVVGDSINTVTIDGIQDIFGEGMIGTLQYTFTTNNLNVLDPPTLLTPIANTKVAAAPLISWQAIDNVSTYEIEVSAASDFSVDTWDTIINDQSTSVTPGVALNDGTYFIRVRYSQGTDYSAWSNPSRFFVEKLLDELEEVPIEDYLEIISVSPKNNSYNLPITTTFGITFDEIITSANVKLIELPQTETIVEPIITNASLRVNPALEINKQYQLIISANTLTKSLYEDYVYNFTTTYSPMYCSINDVMSELGSLALKISPHIIYLAIRDASIYAKQVRTYVEDNNSSLIATDWTDVTNLPLYITQFVRYQAAYNALSTFYLDKAASSGEMRQLADLIVQDYTGSEAGMAKILDLLKAKAKQWLDQLMEAGVIRGYAKPVSAVKGEASKAYLSFHSDRAVWKE